MCIGGKSAKTELHGNHRQSINSQQMIGQQIKRAAVATARAEAGGRSQVLLLSTPEYGMFFSM